MPRRSDSWYDDYVEEPLYGTAPLYDVEPTSEFAPVAATAPQPAPEPARKGKPSRFFTWWRVLAFVVIIALVAVTVLYLKGPDNVRRHWYPLDYQAQIMQAGSDHQLNPYLIAAVIQCESGWDENAHSSAGAVGLMQMLPSTAQEVADLGLVDSDVYPVDNLADPEVNIQYGTAYLRYLVSRYGEIEHAVAAYNAGLGNVDRWMQEGGDIRDAVKYPETAHYLRRVVRAREAYEELYPGVFDGWRAE